MTTTDGLEFWVSVAGRPDGGAVVTIFGELDTRSASRLHDAFAEALECEGEVEIDMRGCGFVDSSGIATLVWAAMRLKDEDRMLRIRGARDRVLKILALAGVAGHSAIIVDSPPQAG